jgi:hypothetical protein
MLSWIVANHQWLFSGIGLTVLGLAGLVVRWGHRRWREPRRTEAGDAHFRPKYEQVSSRTLPTRLPGVVLRLLYKPEEVQRKVKIALQDSGQPLSIYLNSQVPSIGMNFQIINLSAIDLILDRMLIEVWFGQPTFSAALLDRYVVPAGEVTQGLYLRHMLSDTQKQQIELFEKTAGNVGSLGIHVIAYFESKLGRLSVRHSIERSRA